MSKAIFNTDIKYFGKSITVELLMILLRLDLPVINPYTSYNMKVSNTSSKNTKKD